MPLSSVLAALIALPLICAVVMAVLPSKSMPKSVYESIHVVSIAGVLVLALCIVVAVFVSGEPVTVLGLWFRVDALSGVFVALIGVIGFLVGVFSVPYVDHDVEVGHMDMVKVKSYYTFFSLFVFTMLLASTSNNIIMMWICIEATTLATVFLVGAYQTKLALEAAWKYIIVCTCGVAFGLYGTLLVYANAAAVMADPTQAVFWTSIVPIADQLDHTTMALAFTFAVVGFGTKAGLFPMHTWLPDAHSEAPSPVSALLSGVLLKCAMLVIIRFYVLALGSIGSFYPHLMLLVIGGLSVLVAAFSVYVQDDLKRKLAYHSCENIGIVALCLGFGGPLGVAAALLHSVFHGLTKALLFCVSGNILMKYGTRDLNKVTGVLEAAPATGTLMAIGFFALAGFPPFAMFTSEITAFLAGMQSGYLAILIVFGIALTVVVCACAHVVSHSVLGKAPKGMAKGDVPWMALVPEALLVVMIIWFGVALPQPLATDIDHATSIVLQEDVDPLASGSLLSGIADAVGHDA